MKGKKGYHLSATINDGMIEIVISGEITKEGITTLHNESMTIVKEQKPGAVLYDVREVEGPSENLADVYFRVRSLPPDIKKLPCAVVLQSENADYQSFYETTSANVGYAIKFFTDIEEARTWIKSKL